MRYAAIEFVVIFVFVLHYICEIFQSPIASIFMLTFYFSKHRIYINFLFLKLSLELFQQVIILLQFCYKIFKYY